MLLRSRSWLVPFAVLLCACLCACALPFAFPPAPIPGVSAANAAGFNNRMAAVLTAGLSIAVLLWTRRQVGDRSSSISEEHRPLEWRLIVAVAAVLGALTGLACSAVIFAQVQYAADVGYFTEQMSKWGDYHRRLYTGIEFPYGPLLFYPPVLLRQLLSPLHLSIRTCFCAVLVAQQIVGTVLLGYALNALPMTRRWRMYLLLLLSLPALEPNLGYNYTFVRFAAPIACLLFAVRRPSFRGVVLAVAAGEALNLGISPEMGFAFAAGAAASSIYRATEDGVRWLLAALAAPVAAALFLLATGGGYLKMLGLFSQGVLNFLVEPLPHIFIFLFALTWLVPVMLGRALRSRERAVPEMVGVYFIGLALLPVAFGRSDATHVFFNGLSIFLLSAVAISALPRPGQIAWAVCLCANLLLTAYITIHPFKPQVIDVIIGDVMHLRNPDTQAAALRAMHRFMPHTAQQYARTAVPTLDLASLESHVGSAALAVPYEVPFEIEEALKKSGHYLPDSYYFFTAVLDARAERRKTAEFNQAEWALLPAGYEFIYFERPETVSQQMGLRLPYRSKRAPYVAGEVFACNLAYNWSRAATLGPLLLYRKTPGSMIC